MEQETKKTEHLVTYQKCNMPLVEEFDNFYEEYGNDCKIDYANLGDKVMAVPQIKHKWVTRLCIYRNKLAETKVLREKILDELVEEIKKNSCVEMSTATAKKRAESQKLPKFIAVEERLKLLERMVDDLGEIVGHMKYFGNEVSSIIEWYKLET